MYTLFSLQIVQHFLCFGFLLKHWLPLVFPHTVLEGSGGGEGDCIFSETSPLYTESFRSSMRPLDRLVPSCEDLESYWKHLVSLMSLSIMGLLVSFVAIVINCVTPCVEDREDSIAWYPKTDVWTSILQYIQIFKCSSNCNIMCTQLTTSLQKHLVPEHQSHRTDII